jgi:hypothetical protein
MHGPCTCHCPTAACPRYGFMKGHKWTDCQGQESQTRQKLLTLYEQHKNNPEQYTFREPELSDTVYRVPTEPRPALPPCGGCMGQEG